jgi:phosphoglycerate transport regulatory protein PgtC
VPDGVNNGQFGIGLVIDFFGLAGKYSGFPVEFVYPDVTAVVPANIAWWPAARTPRRPRSSSPTPCLEGQQLLYDPKISRLPILPPEAMGGKTPQGYPNPFEIAKRAKVQFDSDLSESRYNVVSALFDQTITFRLKDLQAATKAIHAAEAALAKKPNAKAAALLKEARELAYTPVVDAGQGGRQGVPGRLRGQQEGRRGQQARHRRWKTTGTPARAATMSAQSRWPSRRWRWCAEATTRWLNRTFERTSVPSR